MNSTDLIALENKYSAHNYHPFIVLDRGEGVFVWDVDGKKYFDLFLFCFAIGYCCEAIA